MMYKGLLNSLAVTSVLLGGLLLFSGTVQAEKSKITPICKQCHTPDEKILRGTLGGISGRAETIQVQIGPEPWLVKFDSSTKLIGAESFGKIPKEKEIAVAIAEKGGELYALSVSVKPPAKVPEEKLIKIADMANLIKSGTEKGNYILIDSRPVSRYHEGHIPGAISIYDAEFDKHIEKLPEDKNKLLVFYCAGVT